MGEPLQYSTLDKSSCATYMTMKSKLRSFVGVFNFNRHRLAKLLSNVVMRLSLLQAWAVGHRGNRKKNSQFCWCRIQSYYRASIIPYVN